eukprot:15094342-Ditylum_brightwellii.AAC.1
MLVVVHKLLTSWENHTSTTTTSVNDGIAFATDRYNELLNNETYGEEDEEENVALTTKGEEIATTAEETIMLA